MVVAILETCFQPHSGQNAIYGKLTGSRTQNPPSTFYFGDFGEDVHACYEACLNEPSCMAYTLHLNGISADWRGQCYGRGNEWGENYHVPQTHVTSGYITQCKGITHIRSVSKCCSARKSLLFHYLSEKQ